MVVVLPIHLAVVLKVDQKACKLNVCVLPNTDPVLAAGVVCRK
jgi:hypothetical protein